jgi:hypothetical protein
LPSREKGFRTHRPHLDREDRSIAVGCKPFFNRARASQQTIVAFMIYRFRLCCGLEGTLSFAFI